MTRKYCSHGTRRATSIIIFVAISGRSISLRTRRSLRCPRRSRSARLKFGCSGRQPWTAPIFVAAAVNAAGIVESEHLAGGVRACDDHNDRAAEWCGDVCAVLNDLGVA